jgi:hypothetical protein
MGPHRTIGTVRHWSADGGVLDSPATPGGCWADADVVEDGTLLRAGQVVHLEWRAGRHGPYEFLATHVEADDALETAGG